MSDASRYEDLIDVLVEVIVGEVQNKARPDRRADGQGAVVEKGNVDGEQITRAYE